jgi:hypothetical protein
MVMDEMKTQRPHSDADRAKIGRRFDAVTLPFYGEVALGNGTQWRIGMFLVPKGRYAGWLAVGIEDHGFYIFEDAPHWGYVKEKLGISHASDAQSVADFIASQMHVRILARQTAQGDRDAWRRRSNRVNEHPIAP